MGKEIISNIIGRLKQDDTFPDWWKSEAFEIPYFGNDKLTITLIDFEPEKDKTFLDEAEQAFCECDWEEEHGLQLVFRQGKKLTRISDQDGHLTEADAYDKPDEEDELLSKF